MSKIKIVIDTQDVEGIAKAVKMLQAISDEPVTVQASETEEEKPEKKERKTRQTKPVEEVKEEVVEPIAEKEETEETETTEKVETKEEIENAEEVETEETKSSVTKSSVTLDELRTLLSEKVGAHRELIKNKLKELGAASVSTLSEDKYEAFYKFLDFL